MNFSKKCSSFGLWIVFLGVLCNSLFAEDIRAFWDDQILVSRDIVNERQEIIDDAIPQYILDRAKAVLVVERFKAGFLIGASRGYGVGIVKDQYGRWSQPAFYRIRGASLGLQLGAERNDMILVFLNDESVEILKDGGGEVGAEITAAAGPTNKMGNSNMNFKSHILVYVRGQGLALGAALKAGRVVIDETANQTYYGNRKASPSTIFSGEVVPLSYNSSAYLLHKALDQNKFTTR